MNKDLFINFVVLSIILISLLVTLIVFYEFNLCMLWQDFKSLFKFKIK